MGRALQTNWLAGAGLIALLGGCSGEIKEHPAPTGVPGSPNSPWVAGTKGSGAPGAGPSGMPGAPGSVNGSLPGQQPGVGPDGVPGTADDVPAGADGSAINAVTCTTPDVGPSPLRRLTHTEYDNSVRDLLGDSTQPGLTFAADTQVGLFDTAAKTQTVPVLLADQYLDAAVALAKAANVNTVVGCDPASGATCVRGFIDRFARRAFRRPLASAESDRLFAIYTTTSADSDAPTGVRGVIAAVLASPNFLFKPEAGGAPSTLTNAKLATPFELAGRLASLLWASVPDDTLLDAAAGGQLETPAQVADQARRMLADDKARPALWAFYQQWFGLGLLESATKDKTAYPKFDDTLRDAMKEETHRFVDHVLWEDDAKLSTLFSAQYSILNKPLADLYGVSGPRDATFVQTPLDATQRSGVLTQASVLATFAAPQQSSPIKRGKWVRVRMLCQELPDPPANVPQLPAPKAGVSNRERFAMHTASDACSGCHHLIDGLGFGLEAYDGIGAYRTMDQGVDVDASGEVNTTRDIDGPYSGGPELAGLLARSEQVRDCAPTQWLRYALGREEEEADSCSLVALRDAFAKSGGDLQELMVALTQTDAFMNYRQPE